jgi:5-methylcytosine-specific restriction endonuclease McrA
MSYTRNRMILAVAARDGAVCWLCGLPVAMNLSPASTIGPTVDHVLPKSKGGAYTLDNLRLAHSKCNHARRNRTRRITPSGKLRRYIAKRIGKHLRGSNQ